MQIQELTIYTTQLSAQSHFYEEILGLPIQARSDRSASFAIGRSVLTIEQRAFAVPYHFTINIPANQEHEALQWLKNRVDILRDGTHEILDFSAWNAKAIYFYDADRNVIEFIARKNLPNASNKEFASTSLLEISEIGLATGDIEDKFQRLHQQLVLEIYDGSFERFCAIGDERGLFICVDKHAKTWFPTDDSARPADFVVLVSQRKNRYEVRYEQENLSVRQVSTAG